MEITEEKSFYEVGYDACANRMDMKTVGDPLSVELSKLREMGASVLDAQEYAEGWRHAAIDGYTGTLGKILKEMPTVKAEQFMATAMRICNAMNEGR